MKYKPPELQFSRVENGIIGFEHIEDAMTQR
jgi:hypothetical protein